MSFQIENPKDVNAPSLTEEQLVAAKAELFNMVTFPKVNRKFIDPSKNGEPRFALMSYIPKHDEELKTFLDGIKPTLSKKNRLTLEDLQNRKSISQGVFKIRGAYHTLAEAEARSEEIIRDIDSTNSIFTCIVGVPYPLVSTGHSLNIEEVDVHKETEKTLVQNIREKRKKEQKEIEEMKQREEELMKDTNKEAHEREEDDYIEHRVKLAHLRYTISEHKKKREECIEKEKECVKWLLEMKAKHPEYEKRYFKKYLDARKKANIPDDQEGQGGFMKYMKDPLYNLDECEDCPDAKCEDCPDKKCEDCPDAKCEDCPDKKCEDCPDAKCEDCC